MLKRVFLAVEKNKVELVVLSKEQWKSFSDQAHLLCFNETGFSDIERCDYALLVVKDDVPLMYATIREHDSVTAYMSHGGAFPSAKGTASSYRAFELIMGFLKRNNEVVAMRVLNTNTPMLKFAMKAGFIIDGISYHKNKVYLEHILEVSNVVDATVSDKLNAGSSEQQAS
jgi:hypothetical protein